MKTPIGKRKILIVDDDRTLTDMYGMKFEREGWEVMKSHDGVSWLREISTFRPDVMLLDVMMPGLDGFQTLKFVIHKAKTERISCKVIMFTNLSGSDNERKASESGASGYITKANYTPKEAVAFVMDVLEGSEKEPEAPSMESRIEEDSDGRYFADCPDCSAKMEIVVDENGKPVTVKLEHRENQ